MSTPPNLLLSLSDQTWQIVNFGQETPKWLLENNYLYQTSQVGTSSNLSGTILTSPELTNLEKAIILLKFKPGSTYQSGMVFNYRDPKNMSLVLINRFSESYTGYKLMVLEISDNTSKTIHEEKFESAATGDASIVIMAKDQNLSINLDNKEIYSWTNSIIIPQTSIGFYTQANQDTIFKELYIGTNADFEEITEDTYPDDYYESSIEKDSEMDSVQIYKELEIESPFDPYLKLQSPKSQSQVEFQEVFNVPLDRFYVSLFENFYNPQTSLPTIESGSSANDSKYDVSDTLENLDRIIEILPTQKYLLIIGDQIIEPLSRDYPSVKSTHTIVLDKHTLEPIKQIDQLSEEGAWMYTFPINEKLSVNYRKTCPIEIADHGTVQLIDTIDFFNFYFFIRTSSSNGNFFAYVQNDRTLKILELASNSITRELKMSNEIINLRFSNNESQIVIAQQIASDSFSLNQYDLNTEELTPLGEYSGLPTQIEWNATDTHFLCFTQSECLLINTIEKTYELKLKASYEYNCHFAPDGSKLVFTGGNSFTAITIYDLATKKSQSVSRSNSISQCFFPSHTHVLFCEGNNIYRWNFLNDSEEIATVSQLSNLGNNYLLNCHCATAANGEYFVTSFQKISFFDADGNHLKSVDTDYQSGLRLNTYCNNDKYLAAKSNFSKSDSRIVAVYNKDGNPITPPIPTNGNSIDLIQTSPNGRYGVFYQKQTNYSHTYFYFDFETQVIYNQENHQHHQWIGTFANNSKKCITSSIHYTITSNAGLNHRVNQPLNDSHNFSFAPDGKTMAFRDYVDGNWKILTIDLTNNELSERLIAAGDSHQFKIDDQLVFLRVGHSVNIYSPTGGIINSLRHFNSANYPLDISDFCIDNDLAYAITKSNTTITVWNLEDLSNTTIQFTWNEGPLSIRYKKTNNFLLHNGSSETFDIDVSQKIFLARTGNSRITIFSIDDGTSLKEISFDDIVIMARFSGTGEITALLTTQLVKKQFEIYQDESPAAQYKFIYDIDYRPKQWYRNFKVADDQEAFHFALSNEFQDIIDKLKSFETEDNDGNTIIMSHNDISEQLYRIRSYQQKYQESLNAMFYARDLKQNIIHQVRTNGYLLLDVEKLAVTPGDTSNVTHKLGYYRKDDFVELNAGLDWSLTSKGYEFAIIKGIPSFKDHKPIQLNLPAYDLTDNEDWELFLGNFRAQLFLSGAITKQQQKLFDSHSSELRDFGSSDTLLKRQSEIEEQINQTDIRVQQLEQAKINIAGDKQKWQNDRNKLNDLLNAFDFGRSAWIEGTDLYNKLRGISFEKFQFKFEDFVRKSSREVTVTRRFLFFSRTNTYTITVLNYIYKVSHQYTRFNNHFFGIQFRNEPARNFFQFIRYLTQANNGALDYIHACMAICDYYLLTSDQLINEANEDIQKFENEKIIHQKALNTLHENGLNQLRHLFANYWNDPRQFGARPILDNVIRPDSDPLADLISDFILSSTDDDDSKAPLDEFEIDVFDFVGDRYYNNKGLTLNGYLRFNQSNNTPRIALFPKFDDSGQVDNNQIKAVINPHESTENSFKLPIIKFVETHKIIVTWNGYSLGELSYTENLFPNEKKEITIERTTQLTRKQEESRTTSTTTKTSQTSSFEEKLYNEFSQKDQSENANETSFEIKDISKDEQSSNETSTESENFNIKANVSAKYGMAKASVDTSYSKNRNKTKNDSKKSAHELSKTNKGKSSNKESRESFKKQVANTIKKVAQETTQENKVELKVNTSEEFSALDSRKEVVTLENPNIGRTINYNFFQVQNNYEVKTVLTDVKIVIDYNKEIINGSDISEIRVYDLEELGKIIESGEDADARTILIAAIVARQAFKNYLSGIPGIGRGNGALKIREPFEYDQKAFRELFFSNSLEGVSLNNDLIPKIQSALEYLKRVPFYFDTVEINSADNYSVNTGAYFLDSEVGKMTALEDYLEQRRAMEIKEIEPSFEANEQ